MFPIFRVCVKFIIARDRSALEETAEVGRLGGGGDVSLLRYTARSSLVAGWYALGGFPCILECHECVLALSSAFSLPRVVFRLFDV